MRQQRDTLRLMKALITLDVMSSDLNKKEEAISYYLEVENMADAYSRNFGQTVLYNNITAFYMDELHDYEKAKYFARKGLKAAQIDMQRLMYLYSNLASIFNQSTPYNSSLFYHQKVIGITRFIMDIRKFWWGAYSNYALLIRYYGMYDSAAIYFNKALEVRKKVETDTGNITFWLQWLHLKVCKVISFRLMIISGNRLC